MDWKTALTQVDDVLNTTFFRIGSTGITLSLVLTIIVIVIATVISARAARKAVEARLAKRGGSEGAVGAAGSLLRYAILSIGLSIAAQTAGIDLTALFAAGAVFAVGLGFAMQTIVQNFVAGIILMSERSIRPGDVIEVEGRPVKVAAMGIRSTVVKTRDGEDIIVPNSNLVQSSVKNLTMDASIVRIRFQVGVVYSSDMALVKQTLEEAARSMPDAVVEEGVDVLLVEFGDNAVVFDVGVWVSDAWRLRQYKSLLAERIWWAFADKGITIAFPQLDVHFDPPVVDGLRALSGRAA